MWGNKSQSKILIVEDDLNNHDLFRQAFELGGFKVSIVQTADGDFINEIIGFKPDIISMDLMLGKEGVETMRDGFQAIKLVKSDDRTKDVPVIILTNFFEEGKVQQAKALGVVDFLSLQGQSIQKIPNIFKHYLDNPKKFVATHPLLRN